MQGITQLGKIDSVMVQVELIMQLQEIKQMTSIRRLDKKTRSEPIVRARAVEWSDFVIDECNRYVAKAEKLARGSMRTGINALWIIPLHRRERQAKQAAFFLVKANLFCLHGWFGFPIILQRSSIFCIYWLT